MTVQELIDILQAYQYKEKSVEIYVTRKIWNSDSGKYENRVIFGRDIHLDDCEDYLLIGSK